MGLMKGFLLYLIQEIKGFSNAECRSYTFADCDEAILIPLEEDKRIVNGL
jgi:hypothetical protein